MTDTAKHTPGSWKIEHWDNFPDQQVITDDTNTRCIALIDKIDEQDEANAWLIAAAPELLEACKSFISIINAACEMDEKILRLSELGAQINLALFAISKVEGK